MFGHKKVTNYFLNQVLFIALVSFTFLFSPHTLFASNAISKPKMILQITVDALRGDFLERYQHVLSDGGFRYLMEEGVYYRNAFYQHANTETIVGHTSLATGAVPAIHGMTGNVWYDRDKKRLVYNIEDSNYHLLSEDSDVDKKSEIDYTQKRAKSDGRSPENILVATFSDELAAHFSGKSKIFSVSIKDRSAVAMAGHSGKAFWFSKKKGQFITSNYYYDQYPDWVAEWNNSSPLSKFSNASWNLALPPETYMFIDKDKQMYEQDIAGFGRVFPHAYGSTDDKYFTTKLTLGPAGDQLTAEFAKTLIKHEKLGQDAIPDYLSISFSSTDYVGHIFGASSLESEDNIAQLDRLLSELLKDIDGSIGLDNVLIVLSADHGQPEAPGYLHLTGKAKAFYFTKKKLLKAAKVKAIEDRLEPGDEIVESYFHPYLYLNHDLIKERGLDKSEITALIVNSLMQQDGIALAVSTTDMTHSASELLTTAIKNNYAPRRSGDIHIVFEPNVFINTFGRLTVATSHGSPWHYDTYVPVLFAAEGIKAKQVLRKITPYDIAPTLSALIGIKPPAAVSGTVLEEVFE